jgi:TPP-dependent trihydroxycyclohexane-1,2-dione (THcHDO) dehydratase
MSIYILGVRDDAASRGMITMPGDTVRLTMAQALVRHLCAQFVELDGARAPLFAGAFAIFGHGNVTCLSEALEAAQDTLPTWRGQSEQSMALAAIAFAKAKRRRQMMVAISSIGPGALNMVTAAGVAHANRLPVLLLAGDVFASRRPDPVLQQVECFSDPTISVNDVFRPVTRYWDRITHPEQIISSLPQAIATLLDPADCGPAFLGLCQDTQELAFDYPAAFFAPTENGTTDADAPGNSFTRSGGPVEADAGQTLYVRAHMSRGSYRGDVLVGSVQGGFALAGELPEDFAAAAEAAAPQPEGCSL